MSDQQDIEDNLADLLGDIKKLQEKEQFKIYIPSQRKSILFSPLDIKHQKRILSETSDNELGNFTFINTLNNIILECVVEKDANILLTDRTYIAMALKGVCINNDHVVPGGDGKPLNFKIDDYLARAKKVKLTAKARKFTISLDQIKIDCEVPTLKVDTELNDYLYAQIRGRFAMQQGSGYITSESEPSKNVGDIFMTELAKYITKVHVGKKTINYQTDLTPSQRISLLESLPMKITFMLSENLVPIREYESQVLEVDDQAHVSIDAGLFT